MSFPSFGLPTPSGPARAIDPVSTARSTPWRTGFTRNALGCPRLSPGTTGHRRRDDRLCRLASSPLPEDHGIQAGPCSSGRQHESDRASHKRGCQSGVDCGHQVVVPFGSAPHADRLRADGQATADHPPWESRSGLHVVRGADKGTRGSDRRAAWPRRSRNVIQIQRSVNFRCSAQRRRRHSRPRPRPRSRAGHAI
jgi:hypothetical protein